MIILIYDRYPPHLYPPDQLGPSQLTMRFRALASGYLDYITAASKQAAIDEMRRRHPELKQARVQVQEKA